MSYEIAVATFVVNLSRKMKDVFLKHMEEICKLGFDTAMVDDEYTAPPIEVMTYYGELSEDLVDDFTAKIVDSLIAEYDKKNILKRMFNLLIEGLQNIRIHAEKDNAGKQIAYFEITRTDFEYNIMFGNLVKKSNEDSLRARLNFLNSISTQEVKQHYLSVLDDGETSSKGGAGLGFITIALKSKNKLNYNFAEYNDDLLCFNLGVTLNREL